MIVDLEGHLGAVTRTVTALEREGKPAHRVTLERAYETTPDDLWDALTNPERLPRWFLPVSGELKVGGRFQLEGNAGGTITECEPPSHLAATWEFGGGVSWIEVRVTAGGPAGAVLTLSHICPVDDHWRTYGPGAVGVGWDLGLLGLALHLGGDGSDRLDEAELTASAEGKAHVIGLSDAWRGAAVAGGQDPAAAEQSARLTAAAYTGTEPPGG